MRLSTALLTVVLPLLALLPASGQRPSLDARHLLVDGSLSDTEAARTPYVFNDFRQALAHVADSATLYIKPWVYWVDNPDSPKVVTGVNGHEPFGMTIRAQKLRLVGLSADARDVVLASQRGQTQGAVGNFTMFNFLVDTLAVENLTMGNYCNVDLDYRLRPELSRPRRSDAITQAHVGYVRGRLMQARNVRFVSRLNLNPLCGADESTYDSCHFECTDDALNGNATYRHCSIDLYGQKPFWSTHGRGAMFVDCDFYVKGNNREMAFMKQGGPLTLIDCRYHAPDSTYIAWAPYPQPWLRCYQQNFTLNGQPYLIGNRQPQNTVVLSGYDAMSVPYMAISRHEARLLTGKDTLVLHSDAPHWRVQPGFERYVTVSAMGGDSVRIVPTNNSNDEASFCVEAYTDDSLRAACLLTVSPSRLPTPAFKTKPVLRTDRQTNRAWVDYELDLQGQRDESEVMWWRSLGIEAPGAPDTHSVAVRKGTGYPFTMADHYHRISVYMRRKGHRSDFSAWERVGSVGAADNIMDAHRWDKARSRQLDTDFSHLPLDWQESRDPGFWVVDGYKPADTADYPWTFNRSKPMWTYGEGFNGAVGRGLLQAQRGARLMYTPVGRYYENMRMTLEVDPTKTAGQGFGSATGQYMDVCLKFNTHTLTGFGLRIERTPKQAKAVDFVLVEYDHGKVRPISQAVTATCYRTGCTIALSVVDTVFKAHVETTTPKPADSTLPHSVDLEATITPNHESGLAIQHTGSCGESTTMLHRLKVTWE